jgi:predicted nucleotidyltransferase
MVAVMPAGATGIAEADAILSGLVGILDMLFPGRILATYVTGSYADGTAISASDLDVSVIFKGNIETDERERVWRLAEHLSLFTHVRVDLEGKGEEEVVASGYELKLGGLLVSGDDLKSRIQLPPVEQYVRETMHGPPFAFMVRVARQREWAAYPLDYPDPSGEFYGYDNDPIEGSRDTKVLVAIAGHIAAALIALRTGRFVSSKSQSFRLYRELVDDNWANLLDGIYKFCRTKWQYAIPSGSEDREKLRGICRRLLKLENHFLGIYRDYLLKELSSADYDSALRALTRLSEIAYTDKAVLKALKLAANSGDAAMQGAAAEALVRIEQAHPKWA